MPLGKWLRHLPQAVADPESSLPIYNQVMWSIQDQIYARQEGLHE